MSSKGKKQTSETPVVKSSNTPTEEKKKSKPKKTDAEKADEKKKRDERTEAENTIKKQFVEDTAIRLLGSDEYLAESVITNIGSCCRKYTVEEILRIKAMPGFHKDSDTMPDDKYTFVEEKKKAPTSSRSKKSKGEELPKKQINITSTITKIVDYEEEVPEKKHVKAEPEKKEVEKAVAPPTSEEKTKPHAVQFTRGARITLWYVVSRFIRECCELSGSEANAIKSSDKYMTKLLDSTKGKNIGGFTLRSILSAVESNRRHLEDDAESYGKFNVAELLKKNLEVFGISSSSAKHINTYVHHFLRLVSQQVAMQLVCKRSAIHREEIMLAMRVLDSNTNSYLEEQKIINNGDDYEGFNRIYGYCMQIVNALMPPSPKKNGDSKTEKKEVKKSAPKQDTKSVNKAAKPEKEESEDDDSDEDSDEDIDE